ncbi:hypothetical protein [Methanobacterium sp. SMA-27]|nr:hypothetical protein [Methanobacterium sp. SMA-27]
MSRETEDHLRNEIVEMKKEILKCKKAFIKSEERFKTVGNSSS